MPMSRTPVEHLARAVKPVFDLLFPLRCFACRQEGAVFCARCEAGLARLERPYCQICAHPGADGDCRFCQEEDPAVDAIRAPFLFGGPVREAVHALKYRGIRAAAPHLAGMLADFSAKNSLSADVIVPVPLHPRRLRQRGYNQSQLLAKELGRRAGIPVNGSLLSRVSNSPPQVEAQSRKQRQSNVHGIFQCRGGVQGLSVLLVDDVATTGSTLSSCAASLKQAGADSVRGLVLAREGLDI